MLSCDEYDEALRSLVQSLLVHNIHDNSNLVLFQKYRLLLQSQFPDLSDCNIPESCLISTVSTLGELHVQIPPISDI